MMAPDKIYIHEASAPEMTDKLPYHLEYTRTDVAVKKACRCYCDDNCTRGMSGLCFHKHDGQGQVKNTFKYNECNDLKLLINAIKGE